MYYLGCPRRGIALQATEDHTERHPCGREAGSRRMGSLGESPYCIYVRKYSGKGHVHGLETLGSRGSS